jgi:hypothetical protein
MIEAITDLFVERVPREPLTPLLQAATNLLVVDASGNPRRIADLARLLESSNPVRVTFVRLPLVGELPADAHFDRVWLFVDGSSDLAYCGLYLRELGERFRGAPVELVGIGDVEADEFALVISESLAGSAPPWRRARDLSRGAALLAERLLV